MNQDLLFDLLNSFGPSGSEMAIRLKIEDVKIKEDGKMSFAPVGGIEPATLLGQYVAIIDNKNEMIIAGVISYKDLQDDLVIDEIPNFEDLHIDTGLSKKEILKKNIGIGAYAVPFQEARTLGNENIIAGKALDDRTGCFILTQVAEKLKKIDQDIYYVFTVQEEVGLYGAQTAVYRIDPDWGIAVDVTNAEDYEKESVVEIGKGPVLGIMDAELISNRCLNKWLIEIAKSKRIPLQYKIDNTGTTDATKIMLSKGGVPSTVLGIAIRNLHSTISVGNMHDIKDTIEILIELLKNPPKVCLV